jgi:ApbE superfamily uncharacterized protein (UPF0280 family)
VKRSSKTEPESYVKRSYRTVFDDEGLCSTLVRVKDTDLQILCEKDVSKEAEELALRYRLQIEEHIRNRAEFATALYPLVEDELALPVVQSMYRAGMAAGVGPMAAVAGTIAEYVGMALLKQGCRELVVENGGDIFMKRDRDAIAAIFAGESPLSMRVGIRIEKNRMPIGICTSSGTIGHSLSFGAADSVTVLASSTPLADAAATRIGNEVGLDTDEEAGIQRALEIGQSIEGLSGIVVVRGEKMGAVGDVELVKIPG